MRHATHTFSRRLGAFLLCLALCLSLLPVTALAAAPNGQVIYVGNENVTNGGYWTTDSAGTVTAFTGEGTPADNFIYYDASRNTLTLHNATIRMSVSIDTNTLLAGAAIGVLNQYGDGNAELTITLEGTNTIAEVGKGIFVLANSASTGSSNLTIQGYGSLNASASQTGIWVQSNSKNAALCVENAEVTASSGVAFKNGVLVQAKDGSDVSLTVNGGSLTASVNANIWFQFGSVASGSGTPTVTVSNNAIVRANGGIANNSSTSIQYGTGNEENGGIVFDGNEGTVYGSVTLQENLEIGEGESLTIGQDASLTTDGKLTVNGGTLNGTPNGDVTYKVTGVSLDKNSLTLDVGGSETLTATITPDNATDKSVTWESNAPGVATVSNGVVTAVTPGTATITVKTEDGGFTDTCEVTVTVPVTGVALDKTTLSLEVGDTAQLTATVAPTNATNKNMTWSSSNSAVATVDATGNVKAVGAGTANITVTTQDGNKTATCTVTVEKPYTPPPYIPPTYAVTVPETTGGTVEVSPSRASSGRRVTITAEPDTGYELESLTVLDSRGSEIALTVQGDGKYTFTMPSRKVTVQASFAPVPLPFEDVTSGTWYEGAVRYAYLHDIMEGMSATTFQPNGTLTRAMAVQIFYNLEGQPDISDENLGYPYEDVNAQAWYGDAVYWARLTGVAEGYGDGTFQPTDSITRQEFAQMLYNYAKYKGYDLTAEGDLSQFPDSGSVADWAEAAMSWANGNQLINGHDDGTLEPGGTTTRAQAASILMRFDQKLVEN